GTGLQQASGVLDLADASADREWDAEHRAHRGDGVRRIAATLRGGAHVEDDELVGTGGLVASGLLSRITGVAEVLEPDTLHHATVADVEAGNDTSGQHAAASSQRVSSAWPQAPESSGWNWQPSTR